MGVHAAVKLEKIEEDMLGKMVDAGLFESRDEAARAAIVKYASDLGLFSPKMLWKGVTKHRRRKVTHEQLKKDLEVIEDEV